MIGMVVRGARVAGLPRYLFGPGERNEHVDPHVVAGFRHPAALERAVRPDSPRDLSKLNRLLNQPLAARPPGTVAEKPVWHCALRAAPEDPILSDDAWAEIAHQVVHHVGLAHEDDDAAVRWADVRHADDHIHIVATLTRQDGTKPRVSNDFHRLREACRRVEQQYGLRSTAPADRTAARCPSRAETELAQRQARPEPPRVTLRRAVTSAAATSADEAQFFARLRADGFLVREWFSDRNPGEITGYAVAVSGHVNAAGRPVWFGGGRLASDLTLPKLRHRWTSSTGPQPHIAVAVLRASAEVGAPGADDGAVLDTAWAVADVLHSVAGGVAGSRRSGLHRAAETYDRAARPRTATSRSPPRSAPHYAPSHERWRNPATTTTG